MSPNLTMQLRGLPVGAALFATPDVAVEDAERSVVLAVERHPDRRFAIGEHLSQSPKGARIRNIRIERLPDQT
ncbi:hypothetical protein IAG25_10850 [Caballeronia sp. EK]|uniref:hypothetical protein n=1 Tax=Caballeronia sp. EK TaxID=2767469 RepID=UPI001654EF9D|nr:hypothetical protein [Caballeronia sp. EK]MBC8637310.1 hypothetical protein [Caballeronia sp. EK]